MAVVVVVVVVGGDGGSWLVLPPDHMTQLYTTAHAAA